MMLRKIVVLFFIFSFFGCSAYLRKKFKDREDPYTIVEKLGELYRVTLRFRPDEKQNGIFIAGTFNNWSYPGHKTAGKWYPLHYNAKIDYWVIDLFLKKGLYHYVFILDKNRVVVDWKSEIKTSNGNSVSRFLVR